MTHKSIETFIDKIYSKPPKKNYATKKTNVYHIEVICSLDILDLKDYGPEIKRNYRYVLLIIDNSSKIGWTVPLKKKTAQAIRDSFGTFLTCSKKVKFSRNRSR